MTWGARSLARNAAMTLLLTVLSPYAFAAEPSSTNGTGETYTAVALAGRGKRESNSMPDILIEHVDDGGELPYFPLLVGLMIMGALIVLVLLLLACHLLLRLGESMCSKYRYRRLHPDDSEIGHRTTLPAKPSHVFTYVDLSHNECAHADNDDEENQAPRFAVNFKTAAKVDGSDSDLRLEQRGTPIPAPRRSQLPLRMGLQTGVEEETTYLAPVHQHGAEEGATSFQKAASATPQNPDEPPKKKICSQHVARIPRSRSGGRNNEDGINVYAERCTQFKSVAPEFEINVRDRLVRGQPHGGIPSPSGLSAVTEEVVPGVWAETNQAYYPGVGNTQSRQYEGPLDSSSNPPYGLYETTSQTQSLEGINLSQPDDSVSQQTSTHEQHCTSMSGHGRYEQHAFDEKSNTAIVSAANLPLQPDIDSESKLQDRQAAVLDPSSREVPINTLVEVPDNKSLAGRSPSTPSLKSPSLASPSEDAVSAQETSEASNALGRPIHLDMTLVLPGVTSPQSPAQGTPLEAQSSEMRVKVPKMVAYFDKPPTVQRFKAKLDGSSTECSVPNKPRYPDVSSEAVAKKGMLVSLPSPGGETALVNETIKLPVPPPNQLHLESPDGKSALAARALQSVRKRHDAQDTTEPFSVDEASQQQISGSELISTTDTASGQVEMANSRSRSSLVLAHSQPSMETSPVVPAERSVSTHSRPVVTGITSSVGTNELGKGSDQDPHAVEAIPSPRKRSVDAVSTPMLPTDEEHGEAATYIQTLQERKRAGAALVSPVDSPESQISSPPDSSLHLDEVPPSGTSADKSDGATDATQPIVTNNDGSVLQPAQREVTVQAHSTAEEAVGKQRDAVVSKRDAPPAGKESVPPATIGIDSGQASLVTKEPLEVDLRTKETNINAQMKMNDIKEISPSEVNTPNAVQNQTPVPDRDAAVLSRLESEVPSHKASTSVLETERAKRQALATQDEQRTKLTATAPPPVLMQPVPLPSKNYAILSRADNDAPSHRDEAGTGFVEAEAVGKPIFPKQQPPFPHEEEVAPVKSAVMEKRIFHTPVSSAQDQKSTAVVIRREEVPEEYHTGPFSDSNRRVSEGSFALKPVDARLASIRHRMSLDDPSSSDHQDKLSEQLKNTNSWVESSESQLPPLSSMHSLRSSAEPSHLNKEDSTRSETTFLSNPDFPEGKDNASHEIFSSGHPQSVSEVEPHLLQSSSTALSLPDQSAPPDSLRQGPVSLSQAQHALQNPNLPEERSVTELNQKNILLDSSIVPPYRGRRVSGGKQPRTDNNEPTGPPDNLGSSSSKSKADISQPTLERPHGEMSIAGRQGEVTSAPHHSVVQAEPKPTVNVNADQRKVLTSKPYDSGQVSFPPHPSERELIDQAKVSTVQPAAASRKLLTSGRNELLSTSDDRASATHAVRPIESNAFIEPHEEHRVPVQPMQSEPSSVQLAAPPRTLETRDKDGLVTAPSDSLAEATRQVRPSEKDAQDTFVKPHNDQSVVQSSTEISRGKQSSVQPATDPLGTLETRDKDGLAIAPSDSLAAATRQVRPSKRAALDTFVKPHNDQSVVQSGTEISQGKPSSIQPVTATPGALETRDKDGLAIGPSDSLAAATRQVRPSEGFEQNTSVQLREDHREASDAEILQREPSTVQLASVSGMLASSDRKDPIDLSDSSVATTSTNRPSEVSESSTSVQPHKGYPVASEADVSRESSSLQQMAAPGTLVTSDKSGLPVSLSDGSVEAARTDVPSEKPEKDTSLAPRRLHSELSDAAGSRPLAAKERPASPDVFFGKTSPVSAHGSKDLIVLQTDSTNDAVQEKRADEQLTVVDKPPASKDKTEQSKK